MSTGETPSIGGTPPPGGIVLPAAQPATTKVVPTPQPAADLTQYKETPSATQEAPGDTKKVDNVAQNTLPNQEITLPNLKEPLINEG